MKLAPGLTFEDDWYAVQEIDADTIAIGEPHYHQQNWSYLIRGEDRSLLFDTGSFCRDITGVVGRHGKGDLTVLPSHMHFDHLGNVEKFDRVVLPDLDVLRECVTGGRMTPSEFLFLGAFENNTAPTFEVSDWLEIGSEIDLGGRRLSLLHTPGHSVDSVSLYDRDRNQFFAADYLYSGDLYAQVPGSSLPEYLRVAEELLETVDQGTKFCCAHGNAGPDDEHTAPILGHRDLTALRAGLLQIRAEAATWPDEPEWHIRCSSQVALIISREAAAVWR